MITIYGKANCGFCTKALKFARDRNFKYEYKDVGIGHVNLDELKTRAATEVRTVPQIFVGSNHVGGYTDFIKYVEDTSYTGTGETL